MKTYLLKIFKTIFLQIIAITILIGTITFAAISFPTNVPVGEIAGGKIIEYFTNMEGNCPSGKVMIGFNKDFTKNCEIISDNGTIIPKVDTKPNTTDQSNTKIPPKVDTKPNTTDQSNTKIPPKDDELEIVTTKNNTCDGYLMKSGEKSYFINVSTNNNPSNLKFESEGLCIDLCLYSFGGTFNDAKYCEYNGKVVLSPCGVNFYRVRETSQCIPVGNGYYSPGRSNSRIACTNTKPKDLTYTSEGAGGKNNCNWDCNNGFTKVNNNSCIKTECELKKYGKFLFKNMPLSNSGSRCTNTEQTYKGYFLSSTEPQYIFIMCGYKGNIQEDGKCKSYNGLWEDGDVAEGLQKIGNTHYGYSLKSAK